MLNPYFISLILIQNSKIDYLFFLTDHYEASVIYCKLTSDGGFNIHTKAHGNLSVSSLIVMVTYFIF